MSSSFVKNNNFFCSLFWIYYICIGSVGPKGLVGDILDSMAMPLRKGRLRTLSSTYKSRKFGNSRRCGNGTSTLGVLYPHVTEHSDALLRIVYHGVG